jgi:hypothetical protein
MRILIIILILILVPQSDAFLEITEIMYNPEGADNNHEYIEIYSNENIQEYTIRDFISEDHLTLMKNISSDYILIVEEGFNHTNINSTVYTTGATIGNNLNNDEDLIQILNNTILLDAIHYYSEQGADNNGKSLCKLNNLWQECNPTPGESNTQENIIQEYTIEITEFLPNPEGFDSAPMPEGEWVELFNYGNVKLNLIGFLIKDKANHILTISDTTTYTQIIHPKEYLVIYTNNKSGFLNNEGLEEIKLFSPNEIQIDKVTYSDSREGNSWSKIEEIWHLTKPTPNQQNPDNSEENKESKIEIKNVYMGNDKTARFGDNLRIKVNIYKGDETKNSIKAYIEKNNKKISKTTSFNILQKYSDNTLTIPIQIFPNCNLKEKEGEYSLIIEGLETKDEKIIKIEGITQNLCEKQSKTCSEENLLSYMEEIKFETVINSESSSDEIIYEAQSKKSSRSGIYFFSLILVLLIIHLTTERWKK